MQNDLSMHIPFQCTPRSPLPERPAPRVLEEPRVSTNRTFSEEIFWRQAAGVDQQNVLRGSARQQPIRQAAARPAASGSGRERGRSRARQPDLQGAAARGDGEVLKVAGGREDPRGRSRAREEPDAEGGASAPAARGGDGVQKVAGREQQPRGRSRARGPDSVERGARAAAPAARPAPREGQGGGMGHAFFPPTYASWPHLLHSHTIFPCKSPAVSLLQISGSISVASLLRISWCISYLTVCFVSSSREMRRRCMSKMHVEDSAEDLRRRYCPEKM